MATIAGWQKIDQEGMVSALEQAGEKLDRASGEVVFDFSSVRRMDKDVLQAMDGLASRAAEKGVRVVLCGVNVHIYKVLKLMKLTSRFSFLS